MNISIIIAVYNEENTIKKLLDLLLTQKGIEKCEIIVIDDGSNDNTKEVLLDYPLKYNNIKVIENEKNMGHSFTRKRGIDIAKYETIFLLDSKLKIPNDLIEKLLNSKRNPIMCKINMDPQIGKFNRVMFLIRNKLYKNYYKNTTLDIINKENFENKGKGTGAFLVDKKIILEAYKILDLSKNESDDTKLFKRIIDIKNEMYLDPSIEFIYKNREGIKNNFKHIYQRGPKFVDYYIKKGNKYQKYLILLYTIILLNILFIFKPSIYLYELIIGIFILISYCIYISRNTKDFFVSIYLVPIIITAFILGIIKGTAIKIFNSPRKAGQVNI